MHRLQKLLTGAGRPPLPAAGTAPLPRMTPPVCIIGDLHGRADLLERMLARIAAEPRANAARLIFAGDLIDRGPASAEVLARVWQLVREAPGRMVCLRGNHEQMLLDFLDAPLTARRWLLHGGQATLASFGLAGPIGTGSGAAGSDARLQALAAALRTALPEGLEAWLRALPLWWQDGGLAVSHAGADPALPMAAQTAQSLLWGHRAFGRSPRGDGLWLAHGHVIVDQAQGAAGRIAVDTGAQARGRLSAAWLDGAEEAALRFLQVTG